MYACGRVMAPDAPVIMRPERRVTRTTLFGQCKLRNKPHRDCERLQQESVVSLVSCGREAAMV